MTSDKPAQQQLLIGGEWIPGAAGRTYVKADPFTGVPVTEAAAASVSDAADAGAAAAAAGGAAAPAPAFPLWAGPEPARRREVLERAAELISERAAEIAATM